MISPVSNSLTFKSIYKKDQKNLQRLQSVNNKKLHTKLSYEKKQKCLSVISLLTLPVFMMIAFALSPRSPEKRMTENPLPKTTIAKDSLSQDSIKTVKNVLKP